MSVRPSSEDCRKKFGRELSRLRLDRDLTIRAAAEDSGIDRGTLSDWELGRRNFQSGQKRKVLRLFSETYGLRDDLEELKRLWKELSLCFGWDDLTEDELREHLNQTAVDQQQVIPPRILKRFPIYQFLPWIGGALIVVGTIYLVVTRLFPLVTTPEQNRAITSTPKPDITPTSVTIARPIAGSPLFQDDFQNSHPGEKRPEGWEVQNPDDWAVRPDEKTGSLVYCVKTTGDYGLAQVGSANWKDYTLQVDIRTLRSSGNGSGNIQVRVSENQFPAYVFNFFGETGARLEKETETSAPEILDGNNNIRLMTRRWYTIQIEVIASDIKVFVDGDKNPMLEARDPEPIEAGGIALGAGLEEFPSSEYWEVCFDNVQVTAYP